MLVAIQINGVVCSIASALDTAAWPYIYIVDFVLTLGPLAPIASALEFDIPISARVMLVGADRRPN